MVQYQVINMLDDLNRYRNTKYYITTNPRQEDSHGISYIWERNQFKSMGYLMGLDECGNIEDLIKKRN